MRTFPLFFAAYNKKDKLILGPIPAPRYPRVIGAIEDGKPVVQLDWGSASGYADRKGTLTHARLLTPSDEQVVWFKFADPVSVTKNMHVTLNGITMNCFHGFAPISGEFQGTIVGDFKPYGGPK